LWSQVRLDFVNYEHYKQAVVDYKALMKLVWTANRTADMTCVRHGGPRDHVWCGQKKAGTSRRVFIVFLLRRQPLNHTHTHTHQHQQQRRRRRRRFRNCAGFDQPRASSQQTGCQGHRLPWNVVEWGPIYMKTRPLNIMMPSSTSHCALARGLL